MKIVICGGGTAGWLAALMISSIHRDKHDITVIDSSKIPIIGAGEGSTGILSLVTRNISFDFGCDEEQFLKETDATIKLGIVHKDWYKKGVTYTAPLEGSPTVFDRVDTIFHHTLINNIPFHLSTYSGVLIEQNKTNFQFKDGQMIRDQAHAYHFDAFKVGKYFKGICTNSRGVKHIDAEILHVETNEHGIQSLKLSNGDSISSDLFIDCTGFARKLISSLGVGWTSYRKHLPVNSAMPFLKKYDGSTVSPVTLAWAQSSGWIWRIPTAERYGCGYVYDDRFISDEQAKREIEASFGHEIDPIRVLKFDTGRLDKLWYKNCLALGLCAAFAEPLEATSIHTTIIQIYKFVFSYLKETKEETLGHEYIYNKQMTRMYDDIRDFLVLHYQTSRTDSEFWKWINTGETRTEFVEHLLELSKHSIPSHHHIDEYFGSAGAGLWNWILAGLRHIDGETALKQFKFLNVDPNQARDRFLAEYQTNIAASRRMVTNNHFINTPK